MMRWGWCVMRWGWIERWGWSERWMMCDEVRMVCGEVGMV